ncbi:MAG: hypothetical protein A2504_13310 [Bdellovibrionales bacterium RIFOXYD12_FULL_39_22]|nr:MAG: hypothetical protein A2385_01110 [Bdellovibrionales bacterium RIFOXYB1_FULL_39_21]OFZ43605.1 MAG: hypothetical protein A2485_12780 [Bdellovibrionales bacterium RIFOXYC12_FULL_39_17]OFZ44624.1 MAG: hypothetical protein A2404_10470 [Bdellovibrionales bacterium RIFOXYC1_FULL_39_130]OFZ76383.1 MAG: hypothetical protein A2560_07090 [Bdellovibrionales bacterium RIFOXYD1_FULL_39_84]OFZ94649.1 MAG: hypothetical protein A2504_13310 [Bdellovibrionales bacterium RIFOXYD12_FULL_39_22]HLE12894.1 hy
MKNKNRSKTTIIKHVCAVSFAGLTLFSLLADSTTGYQPKALGSAGLTDQEQQIAETYIHQGLVNDVYKESCAGKEDICSGSDPDSSRNNMIGALSKAYALVIGTIDTKIKMKPKVTAEASPSPGANTATEKAKEPGEKDAEGNTEQYDYCKHIAQATEIVTAFKQQTAQANLNSTVPPQEVMQRELLYRAARGHEARSENAKINTYGWGATTTCYSGYLAASAWSGGAASAGVTLKSIWYKLGAAGLLTYYYADQTKKHKSYADEVMNIAEKLPGKGDCNPVTEVDCYCSQPTTQNDPNYCLEKIYQRQVGNDAILTTCITDTMESDPTCQCSTTNSCYDKKYMSNISALGFGPGFTTPNVTAMKALTTGQLSASSGITAGAMNQANAARDILRKHDSSFKSPVTLSEEQQKDADALEKMGFPANFSRSLAALPSSAASEAAMAKLQGQNGGKITTIGGGGRSGSGGIVMEFESSSGVGKKNKKNDDLSFLDKLKNQKKEPTNDATVLNFAKKATENAEITKKNSGKSIFEIITRRYQVTGVSRLSGEENK